MPITDPLVLPVDVVITPLAALPESLRNRLGGAEADYAITRSRGRTHAKLLSEEGARLLEEFRAPKRVAEAVRAYASRQGKDPEGVLVEAFPLLRQCFEGRFLVPFDSPDAARILATRERGERISRFTILRAIQVLEDAELYQARREDGSLAALKVLRPPVKPEASAALRREVAVLRHLDGSGAPRFLAQGSSRGMAWLAMEWCAGVTPDVVFGELRVRSTPDATRRLLAVLAGIVRAYARLHERGIVHGDVHPKNVLVGRDGEITLVDFGLARTKPPLRLGGTPASGAVALYIPPEYADAELADRAWPAPTMASEQFALGAMFYHLLTAAPYAEFGFDRRSMLSQIVSAPPLPFAARQVVPWPPVEAILARLLAKAPGERFPSIRALADALADVPVDGAPSGQATLPDDGADALQAILAEFLARVDLDGDDFPDHPSPRRTPPHAPVMHGGSGIAYALYRLACQGDDPRLLALADAWHSRTEAGTKSPEAFEAPGTPLTREVLGPVSPFHAESGVHLVRALLALAQGDRLQASNAVDRFADSGSAAWDGLDLTIGRTGVLFGATFLLEALPKEWDKAGLRLRVLGEATLRSVWEALEGSRASAALDSSGVAHGWAGVLYASLRWTRCTGVPFPEEGMRRLTELAAAAESVGRGVRWHQPRRTHATGAGLVDDIPGWCNGPAGMIHLWILAHDTFGDPRYLELAEGSAWSTFDAPSRNPSLCCGLAGQAYALLSYYRRSGGIEWLARAKLLAGRAALVARRAPASMERPLSLFTGWPGLALLAADLAHPETAAMPFFEAEGWPERARHG